MVLKIFLIELGMKISPSILVIKNDFERPVKTPRRRPGLAPFSKLELTPLTDAFRAANRNVSRVIEVNSPSID